MPEPNLSSLPDPAEAVRLENEKLKLLTDVNPPDEILVVSDLHLGRGRESDTQRFYCTENFVADQTFARWLQAMQPKEGKLLVLNGDTFDFIRVANVPQTVQEFDKWSLWLARSGVTKTSQELQQPGVISKKEKTFGLQTDDYKCVWKLLQIFEGHQEFFSALAHWVEQGGALLISKGNHDLDLYWPLVRKAFCAFIESQGASCTTTSQRVFYCDSWIRIRNVYLEHGHVYDPEQQIAGGPLLPQDSSQLNLPLATFVARYLVNKLETLEPFLGSISPTERIPWILLSSHPLAGLAFLGRSLYFISRALSRPRKRGLFWYAVFLVTLVFPLVTGLLIALAFVSSSARDFILKALPAFLGNHPVISSVLGFGLPYIAAACKEFFEWLKSRRKRAAGEDRWAQSVYKTIQTLSFPPAHRIYTVVGHTHDQDIQRLPDLNGSKVLYLNTGAWIPVWPEDRPDLAGQVLYAFAHFKLQNGEYCHSFFEWKDDRNQPGELYILAPSSTK
ncbi:MAG TPA: hypothetical protein VG759_02285 [Candidatus Angelobacter sp.]|nr:hypothetical protein [Candidatus Angelobacter sp.]